MATSLEDLLAHLNTNFPVYYKSVKQTRARNPSSFDALGGFLVPVISGVLGTDTAKRLAEGYVFFVDEVNRAQHEYEIAGHYQFSSYEAVYEKTYDNDAFMAQYHWGVLVTTFFWEHHLRIFDFFRDRFLDRCVDKDAVLADFGSGAGVWSLIASHWRPDVRVTGVDISKTSYELANGLAQAAGVQDRVRFVVGDALRPVEEVHGCHACVSCFLLEHLDRPHELLENMARHLEPGRHAFITAAVTAAEIDHIYEYKSEADVVAMAEQSGFRVVEMLSSAPRVRRETSRYLPRSVALVLQRKRTSLW